MQGSLFSRDFLLEGIAETDEWNALSATDVDAFRTSVVATLAEFPTKGQPNEAQTEHDLIIPVLKALGWVQFLPQQSSAKRRESVPDILLFADAQAKKAANAENQQPQRYRHGVVVAESKAWQMPLDRGAPDLFNQDAPSSQILRYLTQVEIASNRAIQWGILTNGRLWRLYYQGASSRSEEFLELDLAVLADVAGVQPQLGAEEASHRDHLLKAFLLLYRRTSFLPGPEDHRTFHQAALSRAKEWEARVSEKLSETVFEKVFPQLVAAVVNGDPKAPKSLDSSYLDEARHAALTLLYRLLFVFYAEDRNLLPSHDHGYSEYSLRELRTQIQERVDRNSSFSTAATKIWDNLNTIFALIDKGDAAIGLPPYNGGLFESEKHILLSRIRLSDAAIALALDLLSRERRSDGVPPRRINYRDLSVQHLGSIYERLLVYTVVARDERIEIELNPFARKGSGSYYTHEDLVRLIIDRAIGPLIRERLDLFDDKAKELENDARPINVRTEELSRIDAAAAILDLKICDPAMGSGHFLVSLVDYLADAILEAMSAPIEWADHRQPYKSPLIARIGTIRQRIRDEARANHWKVDESHLDDRHLVRRMVLKRCIYGVDKNPVAVELAQVSLWLHTFTVGAPLSFLDHHLRCGDSLFGEWVRPIEDMLVKRGGMFLNPSVAKAKNSAKGMLAVEALTDADIAEVHKSAATFKGVEEATAPLTRFMELAHALQWIEPKASEQRSAIDAFYDGQFGDPIAIAEGTAGPKGKGADAFLTLLVEARNLVAEQGFFNWEVAFPGIWTDWESKEPSGGFDAVIGNPPWDRMKLQEVEWFATRRRDIAMSVRASDRKQKITALEKRNDPLWSDYVRARERAERAVEIARTSGQYPTLSGGDLNIYSLFVERAQRLIKPQGIAGLLVPSGIASDLTSSEFFKSMATNSRLGALLDFENRWPTYFPEVDNRFKFCAFVFGGTKRRFDHAMCTFFLNGTDNIASKSFALSADGFARVNPNTGTAPVFRTKRDAHITLGIYQRIPVLSDHIRGKAWPVRYKTMFHMTNDSRLFRTRMELEDEGCYPIENGRMRKGRVDYAPLIEGKMIQAFDHRAASISINPANLNRPAQPKPATEKEKADPAWVPTPQYWVDANEILLPAGTKYVLGFKEITAPTNVRTMIAALLPPVAFSNKVPLLLWEDANREVALPSQRADIALLGANLNAFVFDYVTRQKIQGQTLNWFIVEQLPVIPPAQYSFEVGKRTLRDLVQAEVLRLTYTALDMRPFARDLGYTGEPFRWNDEDRRHARARLDAIYFQLYGIDEEDVAYILDSFPIVRTEDEKAFGRYRTKEMILGYFRAFRVGDTDARVEA